jgi:exodeoxyribonuclease VII large subunit
MDILSAIQRNGESLYSTVRRTMSLLRQRLHTFDAKLGDPGRILDMRVQRIDHLSDKLFAGFDKYLARRDARIAELSAMLRSPRQIIGEKSRTLVLWGQRLPGLKDRLLEKPAQRLSRETALLEAFSFRNILKRGFTVVRDENGRPVTSAAAIMSGKRIEVEFHDGRRKGRMTED